jgi:predicted enzyme related to lactoylglutathione lyase
MRALGFYGAVLGWDFISAGWMPGDPPAKHYVARLRGKDVAGISSPLPGGALPRPEWMTYVAVESADLAATRAREVGGVIVVEPFDAAAFGRMAVLRDPQGAVFGIWQAGLRRGAQLVNEPSAWAMSTLNTDDPQDATAFYRALFGGKPTPSGPVATLAPPARLRRGRGRTTRSARPGRGDARRLRDPPGASRSWSPTWDQAAATTIEQGGTVTVAPHELRRFRNAVIAHPHGARLSLSQLVVPAGAQ